MQTVLSPVPVRSGFRSVSSTRAHTHTALPSCSLGYFFEQGIWQTAQRQFWGKDHDIDIQPQRQTYTRDNKGNWRLGMMKSPPLMLQVQLTK